MIYVTSQELYYDTFLAADPLIGFAVYFGLWHSLAHLRVLGGLLGNRIVVVIDGVRLNDSTTRSGPNQALNSIPPEVVERVEACPQPGAVRERRDVEVELVRVR